MNQDNRNAQMLADWDRFTAEHPDSKGYDIACMMAVKYPGIKPGSIYTIVLRYRKQLSLDSSKKRVFTANLKSDNVLVGTEKK